MKGKKLVLISGMGVSVLIYAFYIYQMYKGVPVNSDFANFTYEGWDIVKGNILLGGWIQTGLSFYFSELPYYVVSVFLFGFGLKAYLVAVSIMVVGMLCVTMLLAFEVSKRRLLTFFIVSAVAMFPGFSALGDLRSHTAVMIMGFLALFCLVKFQNTSLNSYYIASIVLLSLGFASDPMILLAIMAPLLLFYISLYRYRERETDIAATKGIIGLLVSSVIGFLADKAFYKAGGAYKGSYFVSQRFINIEEFPDKLRILTESILSVSSSNFFGLYFSEKLRILEAFIRMCILLAGFALVFYNIVIWIKGKNKKTVSAVLSLSVALMTVIYLLTSVSAEADRARYLAYFNYAFAVLIAEKCSEIKFLEQKYLFGKISGKAAATALCILAMATEFTFPIGYAKGMAPGEKVLNYLLENGISNAYSGFWDASVSGLLTEDRLHIRAIGISGNEARRFGWFCKAEWYDEPTYTVLYSDIADEHFGSEESIYEALGEPYETVVIDNYKILKYSYDLSEVIKK